MEVFTFQAKLNLVVLLCELQSQKKPVIGTKNQKLEGVKMINCKLKKNN